MHPPVWDAEIHCIGDLVAIPNIKENDLEHCCGFQHFAAAVQLKTECAATNICLRFLAVDLGILEKITKRMFSIIVYTIAIYLVSATIFALELYSIERNEAPTASELWVTVKEPDDAILAAAEQPPTLEPTDEVAIPDVTRRKRKTLIRRLHKLSH